MKKILAFVIMLSLLAALCPAAFADAGQSRAVIGADLNDSQIEQVYAMFGIPRGQVPELFLTNAEERRYLEGFVDSALIGSRSISCVYVELLPEGSGMNIATGNITWCSGEMYVNALSTAGVTDARIIVVSPFEVSGTAALAGIYKAYEDMTGTELDATAKMVGTQELTITGEIADAIGSVDSTSIINELKLMLDQTKDMSDEQLQAIILELCRQYNVNLTDTQVDQLITLCRSLEKLDPDAMKEKVEQVQQGIQKVGEAKDKVEDFADKAIDAYEMVSSFIERIIAFFDGLSKE